MSPGLLRITGGKSDPGQQAIGQCQMIPIGCRCRVVAQLDGAGSGLRDVAGEEAIVTETMIKLGVDGKIEPRAIGLDPALDILELRQGAR